MAANINTNVYSSIVNNNSRIIDEQQVILENYKLFKILNLLHFIFYKLFLSS